MTDSFDEPDFSGDDFANDKQIQASRAVAKAYERMIENSLKVLTEEFNLQEGDFPDVDRFHMFAGLPATISHSLKTTGSNFELSVFVVEYLSSFRTARDSNAGTNEYLFGHLVTKNIYPRTYIQKESLREKIEDIFLKKDVDFDQSPEFSGRFTVVTEDRNKLQALWEFKKLDLLAKYSEMEVEFLKNEILFRISKSQVSVEQAITFRDLTKALLTVFG